jgi:hypothetical protein
LTGAVTETLVAQQQQASNSKRSTGYSGPQTALFLNGESLRAINIAMLTPLAP